MIDKICTQKHNSIDPKMGQDFRHLYEACMNKDFKTRPTSSQLLGLDIIQNWATELGIMTNQISRCKKFRKDVQVFLAAAKESIRAKESISVESPKPRESDLPLLNLSRMSASKNNHINIQISPSPEPTESPIFNLSGTKLNRRDGSFSP